jgi:catechol 2,3-dioxygenase-like lactoylglutathione lyase family enzyme
MTKGKLHHIELYVHDLNQSIEFWNWLLTEKFGYKLLSHTLKNRSWTLDGCEISLIQTLMNYLEPSYNRRRTGLNHIAFDGGSKAQVDELAAELKERRIPLLY